MSIFHAVAESTRDFDVIVEAIAPPKNHRSANLKSSARGQ